MMIALILPYVSIRAAKEEKIDQNIMVWGVVETGADSLDYLTMFKNCPAEVTAQFHFNYTDNTNSQMFDLIMPDSVAQVFDPTPVEKPVSEVVIDKVIYAAVQENGEIYRTEDPNDPLLAALMIDLFDFYHDLFWFDVFHRATYYHGRSYDNYVRPATPTRRVTAPDRRRSNSSDINLDKIDDAALIIGVAAVAVATTGMMVAAVKNWDKPDDRFPYVSLSPQVQYFTQTGTLRNVLQVKARIGHYGGFSFLGDMGFTTGSLNEAEMFDPGFTWSAGVGFDLGAFSLQLRGKPAIYEHDENFITCNAVYDWFISRNFAIDLSAGVGIVEYQGDYYADVPVSVGLLWKF